MFDPDRPGSHRIENTDPRCPKCGYRAEDFYFAGGDCIGCEACVRTVYYLNIGESLKYDDRIYKEEY